MIRFSSIPSALVHFFAWVDLGRLDHNPANPPLVDGLDVDQKWIKMVNRWVRLLSHAKLTVVDLEYR